MVPDENIAFTDGCMGEHTENLLRDCGDFYLRRADGVFAYQLAVVVDDAGWVSPKSCAGPTCFPLRRGSSICTGFWVCLHRSSPTALCCWRRTGGGSPSGTRPEP